MNVEQTAIEPPDRVRRASYRDRLARRSGDAPLAVCVGIDPSPDALALLEGVTLSGRGTTARATRAGAIERFAGLVIESARDHAVAVKPQIAWFEQAGVAGIRALERTVEFARTAGLLVVLDAKRGDVPHSAAAYADAWLGDDATSGIDADALTVHAAVGRDSIEAMARVAADRHAALYALLHTSNPGAVELQAAPLADGSPWWHALARMLADVDAAHGGGVVGAVVGATHPDVLATARELVPTSPLLLPGIGTQGGRVDALASVIGRGDAAPPTLVTASRSLLPDAPASTAGFRFSVAAAVEQLAAELARTTELASQNSGPTSRIVP